MNRGNIIPVLEFFHCNSGFLRPDSTTDLVRCPSCFRVVHCARSRIAGHITRANGSFLPAQIVPLSELSSEQADEARWQPSFYQAHTDSNREEDLEINLDDQFHPMSHNHSNESPRPRARKVSMYLTPQRNPDKPRLILRVPGKSSRESKSSSVSQAEFIDEPREREQRP
jgi:hypothetical protein